MVARRLGSLSVLFNIATPHVGECGGLTTPESADPLCTIRIEEGRHEFGIESVWCEPSIVARCAV